MNFMYSSESIRIQSSPPGPPSDEQPELRRLASVFLVKVQMFKRWAGVGVENDNSVPSLYAFVVVNITVITPQLSEDILQPSHVAPASDLLLKLKPALEQHVRRPCKMPR